MKNRLNIQPILPNSCVKLRLIKSEGARPKLIKSDKESNSAPNCDDFFSFLAIHPSKKSKKAANIIIKTDSFQFPCIENLIDDIPAINDINVIELGMNFINEYSFIKI